MRVDPDDEYMNDTLFVGDDCDEDNLEDMGAQNNIDLTKAISYKLIY